MRGLATVSIALALVVRTVPATADDSFFYADAAAPLLRAGAMVVDARPSAACQARTVKGARCLPAADFLGPHRRLAAVPDILWALGTAGLTGAETVLVVGDEPTARDFVAGLLYLSGQRQVAVLRAPVGQGAGLPPDSLGQGTTRGMVRETIFQAPVRDDLWVLRNELAARLTKTPTVLLDGRGESEFWGETVRAARGGRLPGAESLPVATVRAVLGRRERPALPVGDPVVYAHDAVEGIAFFALLRAGADVPAQVYPGGWAEWAADGSLAADGATHPDRAGSSTAGPATGQSLAASPWSVVLAGVLFGVALAAGGFYFGRRGGRAA